MGSRKSFSAQALLAIMFYTSNSLTTCEDCLAFGTIRQHKGENLCIDCGCVSRCPVFVDDVSYTSEGSVYYGDVNDRCSKLTIGDSNTDSGASCNNKPAPKVTVPVRMLMQEALSLSDGTMAAAVRVYTDYLATGTRVSEDKHLLILATCVYVVSKARTVDDICKILGLNSSDFHTTYKSLAERINVQRTELTADEGIRAVSNMLPMDTKAGVQFRKQCWKLHERISKFPKGKAMLRQVQNTKLYATLGLMSAQFMKMPYTEKELCAKLGVTIPTVRKVRGLVMDLLRESKV